MKLNYKEIAKSVLSLFDNGEYTAANLKQLFGLKNDLDLKLEGYFNFANMGRLSEFLDDYWIDDNDRVWVAATPEDFIAGDNNVGLFPLLNRQFTIKENFIAIDTCFTTLKDETMSDTILISYKKVVETFVFDLTKKVELDTANLRQLFSLEFI